MPKFRKRPVEIEAVQYTPEIAKRGWPNEICEDHPWLDEAYNNGVLDNIGVAKAGGGAEATHIAIKTLEGVMRCDIGDWIIRGVKGELYPCKPDIFTATYYTPV
jgi:hypothetical protein